MKGATNQAIGIMILLVLGVVVLLVVTTMVLNSGGVTSDLELQNALTNCCIKFLPECSNLDVTCYIDSDGNPKKLQQLADDLGVNPKEFCGCN